MIDPSTILLMRSAQSTDLHSIHQLALESGVGITSLPKDPGVLQRKLTLSVASIEKNVQTPGHEYYLFVLENPLTQEIVGTSAIKACVDASAPSYTYKILTRTRMSLELNIRSDEEWLWLVNDFHGFSELCTLFLKSDYRQSQYGRLLSRARFLFIAQHPNRFANKLIAELRGHANDQGESPFWNNLGRHFFQMSFQEADELTLSSNKHFIADLMPDHPLPVMLLEKKAQAVIGVPHPSTKPAMHLLLNEGFHFDNHIDIFDAGPILQADVAAIRSIHTSTTAKVIDIVDNLDSIPHIVCNSLPFFRATITPIMMTPKGAVINEPSATVLQIKKGDSIRFVVNPQKRTS